MCEQSDVHGSEMRALRSTGEDTGQNGDEDGAVDLCAVSETMKEQRMNEEFRARVGLRGFL